ncbi:MAG: ATP-binding protein, partial [Thermodesulfovibrionales bacterium]
MRADTNHRASITVPSHPMYLSMIRAFIEKLLLLIDTQASVIEDVKSGVDEACSNIIKYAYKYDYTKTIKVSFDCSNSQ